MTTRITLKTYFVTGASPTEAQFSDLIDSSVNVTDDLTAQLTLDDATKVLTAAGAKALKDSLDVVGTRVTTLEGAGNTFATNYYNKTEVDASVASIGGTIDSGVSVAVAARAVLEGRIIALETSDADDAEVGHVHPISEVTSLQAALDAKVSTATLNTTVTGLNTSINTKAAASHTHVMADITDLSGLSGFATTADLATKAALSHAHAASEVSGIGDTYYNKTEVDSRISAVDTEHTHTESEITNLDKYTQAQTDIRIQDHDDLINNPHAVTKAQAGLGSVENLDTTGIFAAAAATAFVSTNVTPVNDSIVAHAASVSNPHTVTKTQVGLGSVPNVDVQALLATHEAANNPHGINLSFFDVFSKAETNTRIEYYISAKIYNFTPTSATDSAGAIGDITYNSSKLHIKTAATAWLSFYDTAAVDAADAAIQADVDQNESDADAAIAVNAAALAAHEADTTNPHSVTKTQVGLSNVDNVQQTPLSYRETAVSLGSDSDDRWASVKAIRAYVDANSYAAP